MMNRLRLITISLVVLLITTHAHLCAGLKLPSVFSEHMVLQREKNVRVWGLGDVGDHVKVIFADQKKETIVNTDGTWELLLDPMKAMADPKAMTISSASETKKIGNILVGDIWIYSGQSNMEFRVPLTENGDAAMKTPANPNLRYFFQRFTGSPEPEFDVLDGHWKVDDSRTRTWLSAVAYYFIQEVYKKEKVPMALMKACIGGSSVQMWTPLADLKKVENTKYYLQSYEKGSANYEDNKKEHEMKVAAGEKPKITDHFGWFPTATYNAMIHPIQNFSVKGILWYQGESNTDSYSIKLYHKLFSAMIQSWRREMKDPKLPFYFVQLPKFNPPEGRFWPEHREAQRLTAEALEHTEMVVTFDTGDSNDIHPKLKKPIGERLSRVALNKLYGHDIEYTAPLFDKAILNGQNIELSFTELGSGLMTNDDQAPREFTVCGTDQKFLPAQAKIVGDKVVVSCDDVDEPVSLRYAWRNDVNVNLFGKNGLPVGPFKTKIEDH